MSVPDPWRTSAANFCCDGNNDPAQQLAGTPPLLSVFTGGSPVSAWFQNSTLEKEGRRQFCCRRPRSLRPDETCRGDEFRFCHSHAAIGGRLRG
jgi:hypothetical protein